MIFIFHLAIIYIYIMKNYFIASKIGKREENEDRHNVITNINKGNNTLAPVNYYGVYDGHGGKFVSTYLAENLPQFFMDPRIEYPLQKNYVNKIYGLFTKMMKEKYLEKATQIGSTCLVVVHYKENECEYLNILNTGDSRCVLCRNNLEVSLTKDHKPNWPEENQRIKALGGQIKFDGFDWRIRDLSVSRAFGDFDAEPYVVNTPDIYKYKLSVLDKFMVVACDGLWDILSNQDVVNFVLDNCYDMTTNKRLSKHVDIAKKLADHAIAKGSTDNVTVIVIFF